MQVSHFLIFCVCVCVFSCTQPQKTPTVYMAKTWVGNMVEALEMETPDVSKVLAECRETIGAMTCFSLRPGEGRRAPPDMLQLVEPLCRAVLHHEPKSCADVVTLLELYNDLTYDQGDNAWFFLCETTVVQSLPPLIAAWALDSSKEAFLSASTSLLINLTGGLICPVGNAKQLRVKLIQVGDEALHRAVAAAHDSGTGAYCYLRQHLYP